MSTSSGNRRVTQTTKNHAGTLKLSSITTKIVEDAFGHSISNERQRSLKRKQPIPDTPFTKCPKLDPTIQSRLPKPAKDADRNLARIQTLVLDAAAPLLSTLEAARSGSLTPKGAAESAHLALKLLGNASANISTERRRKATTHLNPELGTLIEDEDNFCEAVPFLFSKAFDQQAKDHIEAVKSLKKTTFTSTRQPFQRGHPSSTWGGGTFRGRGTNKKFSAREKNSVTPFCVKSLMKMLNVINTRSANESHHMTCMTPTTEVVPQNKVSLSPCNQQHGDYTTCVRQHTDLSDVRVYTSQADVCDSVWSPLHNSRPTNPSPIFVTEGSTMDSADPIRDNTNCSRALHNSSICRQDQPVSGELEGFILRQLGPTDCDQGIPYSPHCRSSSKVSPSQPTPTTRRCYCLGGGNSFFTAEADNPTNSFLNRGVLFKHVPGAKERGRSETCNKSQTSEQICEIRALQDGGVTYNKNPPPEERLDGKNRLEGCLLHDTHGPSMPSPPPFQSREEVIPIQLSPLRPMHGPQSVYQNSQASCGDVEVHGTSGGDIHRRHASHGILQRFPYGSHSFDPVSPRFIINEKKSLLEPTQEIEFLAMIINSKEMDISLPGSKIRDIKL